MKKITIFLLVLGGLFGVVRAADADVARVDVLGADGTVVSTTTFGSVAYAFAAVNEGPDGVVQTLTLLNDASLNNVTKILSGKVVVLDLGTYMLLLSPSDNNGRTRGIQNYGTLTIRAQGKGEGAYNLHNPKKKSYGLIDNYGTLVIESGHFDNYGEADSYMIRNHETATSLTISGGTFTSDYQDHPRMNPLISSAAKLVIKGGTFKCTNTSRPALNLIGGEALIESPESITAAHHALAVSNCTVTINSGTITSTSDDGAAIYGCATESAHLVINGGTFSARQSPLCLTGANVLSVTGGKFKYTGSSSGASLFRADSTLETAALTGGDYEGLEPRDEAIPEGYKKEATGTTNNKTVWTIKADTDVAQIGENKYGSLEIALDNVKPGETVTLLKDVEAGEATVAITIPASVTLDLSGRTLAGRAVTLAGAGAALTNGMLGAGSSVMVVGAGAVLKDINLAAVPVTVKADASVSFKDATVGTVAMEEGATITNANAADLTVKGEQLEDVVIAAGTTVTLTYVAQVVVDSDTYKYRTLASALAAAGTNGGAVTILKSDEEVPGCVVFPADYVLPANVTVTVTVADGVTPLPTPPADYKWVDRTLVAKVYVATVTGAGNTVAKYESLAEAVAEATSGETVTILMHDVTWPEDFVLSSGVTIVVDSGVTPPPEAPEGYKWDENNKLVIKEYVAQITNATTTTDPVQYETLAAALAAATSGDTITIRKSEVTFPHNFVLPANVTITVAPDVETLPTPHTDYKWVDRKLTAKTYLVQIVRPGDSEGMFVTNKYELGSTAFPTLNEEEYNGKEQRVTLLGNVTLDGSNGKLTINAESIVSIDFGAHRLALTPSSVNYVKPYSILNYGTLTLTTSSSKVMTHFQNAQKESKGLIENHGTLVVNGGKFEDYGKKESATIHNHSTGKVAINGGTFVSYLGDHDDKELRNGFIENEGELTITGGAFECYSTGQPVFKLLGGTATIEPAEGRSISILSAYRALKVTDCATTIKGGTFRYLNQTAPASWFTDEATLSNISVTGGRFVGLSPERIVVPDGYAIGESGYESGKTVYVIITENEYIEQVVEPNDYVAHHASRAQQRYPWNNYVDIEVVVKGVLGEVPLSLVVTNATQEFEVKALTCNDKTFTNGVSRVGNGTYNFRWNTSPTGVDDVNYSGVQASDVFVAATSPRVEQLPPFAESYLVIDLATEGWPFTFLDAAPAGGWTVDYATTKLVLRKVSAGKFKMGSPVGEVGRADNEETPHEVKHDRGFWVGVFEVTQKQWYLVMGENPSANPAGDTYPVENVSYNDIMGANGFVAKLVAKTGLALTLPTEAQWEYACRAGTTTALNNGTDLSDADITPADGDEASNMDTVGCYNGNGGATASAGTYAHNDWGLYDMHGNVQEWCLGEAACVLRGGSWNDAATACRSAARVTAESANAVSGTYGFRLAAVPGEAIESPRFALDLRKGVRDTDKAETLVRAWQDIKSRKVEIFAVPVTATVSDAGAVSDVVEYGDAQRLFVYDATEKGAVDDTYAAENLFVWEDITNAVGLVKVTLNVTKNNNPTPEGTAYFRLPEETFTYDVLLRGGGSLNLADAGDVEKECYSNRLDKTVFKTSVQDELNAFAANGLRGWENLVTGNPETHYVKTHATVADTTTLTVSLSRGADAADAVAMDGYTIRYLVRKFDLTDRTWKQVRDAQTDATFAVPLEAGYYRLSKLISPASDSAIVNEIPSTNIVGVMEVKSAMTNTLAAVPWLPLKDDPTTLASEGVAVSDLVATPHLSAGDAIRAVSDDGTVLHWIWTKNGDGSGAWESGTTARLAANGAMSVASAGAAEDTAFARGDGVWVTRENPEAGSFFLVGTCDPSPIEKTLAGGEEKDDACSFVTNPKLSDVPVNDYAWNGKPLATDLISIPNGNNGRLMLTWDAKTSTWGQWVFDPIQFKSTWKNNYTIKAGTGFWYHRTGEAFTLPLPQDAIVKEEN